MEKNIREEMVCLNPYLHNNPLISNRGCKRIDSLPCSTNNTHLQSLGLTKQTHFSPTPRIDPLMLCTEASRCLVKEKKSVSFILKPSPNNISRHNIPVSFFPRSGLFNQGSFRSFHVAFHSRTPFGAQI